MFVLSSIQPDAARRKKGRSKPDPGWSQQQKLIASDGAAGDWFGQSVSISGDLVIVGAQQDDDKGNRSGSAYIFERDGTGWVQQQKLLAADGAAGDRFGRSVSISGDFAIVGAPQDDDKGDGSGSAYIFKWNGASWVQQQKLLAADGAAGDRFGPSVSISGDLAIVGAPDDDDKGRRSGSAYIFKRDGTSWVQQQKLLAADGAAIAFFGTSVSISGDLAIVGADEAGSAYIFKWDGPSWVQQQKLLAADGAAGDGFGVSVSISGDLTIVGAHYDDDNGEWTGSAYIFKWDGTSWIEQQKLLASDGAAGDRFGVSVSISGDLAVVGAYWDDDACPGDIDCDSGSAYLLNLPGNTYAFRPNPADKATGVPRDVVLNWTPGFYAPPTNRHKVYFGESFNDVNDATGAVAQTAASYTPPQRLDFGTTYYWRVDEVNGAPDFAVFRGDVWRFTVGPFGIPIANITATASSANPGMEAFKSIDGSGLDGLDQHSIELTDTWLSTPGATPWIQYEFDKIYTLHEMWVWNSNQQIESFVGLGAKDVLIEYSTDGIAWAQLDNVPQFAQATGQADYIHNTTVDFGGVLARFVRITVNTGYGMMPQYSLSEVRFFFIPIRAREPQPAAGAITDGVDVLLKWRAGHEAVLHEISLSTDSAAVADGMAVAGASSDASFDPGALDYGTTYFWKVDEVNEAGTPARYMQVRCGALPRRTLALVDEL